MWIRRPCSVFGLCGNALLLIAASACGDAGGQSPQQGANAKDVPTVQSDDSAGTSDIRVDPLADAPDGSDVAGVPDVGVQSKDVVDDVGRVDANAQDATEERVVTFTETCDRPWCLARTECPAVEVHGLASVDSHIEITDVKLVSERVFRADGVVDEVLRFSGTAPGELVVRRRLYGPTLAWESEIDTVVYEADGTRQRFEVWRRGVLVYVSTAEVALDDQMETLLPYPKDQGGLGDEPGESAGTPKGTLVLHAGTACRSVASGSSGEGCSYPVTFKAIWGSQEFDGIGPGSQVWAGAGGGGDHWWWRVCSASISDAGNLSVVLEGGLWTD